MRKDTDGINGEDKEGNLEVDFSRLNLSRSNRQ